MKQVIKINKNINTDYFDFEEQMETNHFYIRQKVVIH